MAHSAFTVGRERCFFAAGFKLMAEVALHPGADNLGRLTLHVQMKLVREVEQNGVFLVVIGKLPQFRQRVLRYLRVADRAEFRLWRLSFKELLMTGITSFVARPVQGGVGLAGLLMTIRTLRSSLQVLAVAELPGGLRGGLGCLGC